MTGLAQSASIAIAIPIAIAIKGRPPVVLVRIVGPHGPWKVQEYFVAGKFVDSLAVIAHDEKDGVESAALRGAYPVCS
jgi:hypothetical protein